jgi:hypothetical protein
MKASEFFRYEKDTRFSSDSGIEKLLKKSFFNNVGGGDTIMSEAI